MNIGHRRPYKAYATMKGDVEAFTRAMTVDHGASSAVFLASDESSFMTGEVVTIDGGVSLTGPRYR